MDEQLENRLRFLRDAHTGGMPHSGRALFDHLLGTRRGELQQLIGEEAESLVWLFCIMRRDTFFQGLGKDRSPTLQHRETGEAISLSDAQRQDLLTLLLANSMEGFPRCTWFQRRSVRGGLRRYRSYAAPSVQKALDRYAVRWWKIWK